MALHQFNLEGKDVEPWYEICCRACWFAKGEVCRCRCHKANHGKGVRERGVSTDKELPESEAKEFRKQYRTECRGTKCLCGNELKDEPIMYYVPHEGGWTIKCEKQKAWLFVHCPKCGYDMSIWKMGVPRE